MMNDPTNRAITANTIRNVVKNDSPCWIWSCDSLVAASPVMASVWAGSRARMACDHLGLRDARRRLHPDDRHVAGSADEASGAGRVEQGHRRAEQSVLRAELGDADDALGRTSRLGQQVDLLAHLEAVRVGRLTVDHDLAGSLGRAPRGDAEGVQRGVRVPAATDGGGAAPRIADGLAGMVDELGVPGGAADGVGHAGRGPHGGR